MTGKQRATLRGLRGVGTLTVLVALIVPPRVAAFSVLAHQAVVDAAWESSVVPALRRRFPAVGDEELKKARAYAYGGSHIQDLGYFPLGNRLFTDLTHYVRSGDFVASSLERAGTVDEYAFALGALSHYVTDDVGHPEATNPSVAEIYPKLRERYGETVTYADDPSAHITTEFRFDVLQVARRKKPQDLVEHALDFQVAQRVLDDAFHATYGLHLDEIFTNTDVAITTYRWAFREAIHEVTGIAWGLYQGELVSGDAGLTREKFVSDVSRSDFEKQFGKSYREPGYFAKLFGLPARLVPNIGPLKRLPYKPLPANVRKRFETALEHAVERYRAEIGRMQDRQVKLPNETLDTGGQMKRGEYEPADHVYAQLLEKLRERDFVDVPPALRADILRFYREGDPRARHDEDDDEDEREVRDALERLAAAPAR
jgi:Zinc dependent phospholipase C